MFYQIIAGERRWRAARLAGLKEVPVIIRSDDTERSRREVSLIENVQRENLNIIEEAEGYNQLIRDYNLTQEEIANKISKSRVHISNTLRLLNLEPEIIEMMKKGEITAGHGKALLAVDKSLRLEIAKRIVSDGLNVREIENLSRSLKTKKKSSGNKDKKNEIYYQDVERKISDNIGRKTVVRARSRGGEICIEYYDDDDFEVLFSMIMSMRKK